jgi:hypothetical protein
MAAIGYQQGFELFLFHFFLIKSGAKIKTLLSAAIFEPTTSQPFSPKNPGLLAQIRTRKRHATAQLRKKYDFINL